MTGIAQKVLKLSRRPEARHVGILTSGSIAAQVALIATAPLLSRLYHPAAYGVFSLMLTISTIGGAIGGLCYEVAVILPRSRRRAIGLYWLAFYLSFLTPAVMIGLVALVQHFVPRIFGRPLSPDFYYYCFAGTTLTTLVNVLSYAHSRVMQFAAVSVSKFSQTLFPAIGQIALAYVGMGNEGLLMGRVLGMAGSVAWLCHKLPRGFRLCDFAAAGPLTLYAAGKSYRDFLYQVPRQLLVRSGTSLPSALVLGSYGPVAAGLYFFATRLIERPGMLLGDSLTRVPMRQFAARVQKRQKLTRSSILYTAAMGVPVIGGVILLALTAHPLFRIIFGVRWESAADYSVVLAWWAAVRLTSLPMATLTTVLRVQKMSLYVDVLFSFRVVIIPILAHFHFDAISAVTAFCGLSIVYHLVIVAVGLWAAMRYDRALSPVAAPFDALPTGETYV
ncbi:MAG TPA: oligosaccharide flippase family protein [Rhizomicrobium sp.]|nr:oligosaccharide flippase family protein [Rhizomicrobium sp.]